jgi:prephenate dehydratase
LGEFYLSQPSATKAASKVAIQGELGSNSHVAALDAMAAQHPGLVIEIVPCALAAEACEAVQSAAVDFAVLPIENTLHGSVAEHLDLLLTHDLIVTGESLLRVRHNVIAAPGVRLADLRQILSHPVALSQCRRWLRAHPHIAAVPFYDTAGSVKHLMADGLCETAGIAPALAASQYGAEVLVAGIEDHPDNFTRFLTLEPPREAPPPSAAASKLSIAFSLEHRPGTLLRALEAFSSAGLNLTKIESRPVHGRPWEYVFFVDVRFEDPAALERALASLTPHTQMLKELGRYPAA